MDNKKEVCPDQSCLVSIEAVAFIKYIPSPSRSYFQIDIEIYNDNNSTLLIGEIKWLGLTET